MCTKPKALLQRVACKSLSTWTLVYWLPNQALQSKIKHRSSLTNYLHTVVAWCDISMPWFNNTLCPKNGHCSPRISVYLPLSGIICIILRCSLHLHHCHQDKFLLKLHFKVILILPNSVTLMSFQTVLLPSVKEMFNYLPRYSRSTCTLSLICFFSK